MPWNECKPMDERLRFVARLLEGEQMAPLCREFGISRVTGYKIFNRYKECGLDALYDRSRRPYRHANKLPFQVERCILGIKREHASWGAPKVRDKLIRQFPMIKAPAIPGMDPDEAGAPERIRTPDPQIRSLVLYPAELRAPRGRVDGRRIATEWTGALQG